MKMSQYNWSWWFVLTLILMVVGMLVAMEAKTNEENICANVIMSISLVSMLPCLYVGMKPSKN